ncbi:transposase [Streptomyces sp. NBC_00009]|uniref:transposase n=1 Tax=Streptomyces sp. NBC_00009 TaxID=2975620 RepID=UPI00386AC77A
MELLLPDRTPKRGGRWRDHREVIDAIAFKLQTGTQWVHLPEKYGNWRGVYNRLRMWAIDGTWERVFATLMAQADAEDDLNWAVSVDSTIVRAPPARRWGPQKKGPQPASPTTTPSDGPAADRPRRSTSSPTPAAAPWPSSSLPDRPATHPPSSTSWSARAFPGAADAPGPDAVLADKTPHAAIGSSSCCERGQSRRGEADASSNFWRVVKQWWSWPSMRLKQAAEGGVVAIPCVSSVLVVSVGSG